jgi:glycosyltransferase involved in cell wall biosynthesis
MGAWAKRRYDKDIAAFVGRYRPRVIYANTIWAVPTVDLLGSQAPVIVHIHELEFTFKAPGAARVASMMAKARRFIACSKAVEANLVNNHGIGRERIELVYESIPVGQIKATRTRDDLLADLRIPPHAKVVVSGGSGGWRKGADLFVQLAKAVCQKLPDAYFVWIGGYFEDRAQIEHDARLCGVEDRVRLTGSVSDVANYLAAGDLFVLTSREDPYPLICLEAAALEKPIVCFADAGGMPEFVEDDCGLVVPYLDLGAMAAKIALLLERGECRLKMGKSAKLKVTERHDVSIAVPRILEIIEKTMAGG